MPQALGLEAEVEEKLLERNQVFERFFAAEAPRLAEACRQMAERFERGGRLLAFGRGCYCTDAQHVAVEFVHPIVVGKRALPALDLSLAFRPWLEALVKADDIVMGFGPPEGDPEVAAALEFAKARDTMTFALPGVRGSYAFAPPVSNAFVHQELTEILYHTLWETVHVFLEHRSLGQAPGAAAFLYPFLNDGEQATGGVVAQVAESIRTKVADDAALRVRVAKEQASQVAQAARAIAARLRQGGKIILFGNGGSATDANDWALDLVAPPSGCRPLPAISLASEPAVLSAIANDVGLELVFSRQLIAHARPEDVAIGISTSGGSKNIIDALRQARKDGLLTVALLGYDGGEILRRSLADFNLVVPCDYIPRIQEVQASVYHVLRESLEVLLDA